MLVIHPNVRVIFLLKCCKEAIISCESEVGTLLSCFLKSFDVAAQQVGFSSANEALDSWISWFQSSNVHWPFFEDQFDEDDFEKLDRKPFKGAPLLLMAFISLTSEHKIGNFYHLSECLPITQYEEKYSIRFISDLKRLKYVLIEPLSAEGHEARAIQAKVELLMKENPEL